MDEYAWISLLAGFMAGICEVIVGEWIYYVLNTTKKTALQPNAVRFWSLRADCSGLPWLWLELVPLRRVAPREIH